MDIANQSKSTDQAAHNKALEFQDYVDCWVTGIVLVARSKILNNGTPSRKFSELLYSGQLRDRLPEIDHLTIY